MFFELLNQCRAAGLTAAPVSDNDVAILHALFDVALHSGLGSLVYDYVVEVCSDKYCTSRYTPGHIKQAYTVLSSMGDLPSSAW